jgi:hypothetical protein
MEMAHMMECLLAKMRINQAKADTNLKEIREGIKTNQIKAEANLREITEDMRTWRKDMKTD